MKKNVIILGSTGSIGINTLEVVSNNLDKFNIFALAANSSIENLSIQCQKFNPAYVHVNKEEDAKKLSLILNNFRVKSKILFGREALNDLVSTSEVDTVVCAISGSAGLESSLHAVKSGKRILLANKESLVMCGKLFMDLAKKNKATVLPVDSEHNALHQCFSLNNKKFVKKIILTASGGPFLNTNLDEFENITIDQALDHPTWNMGKKISIDSATMMNKGLEIIEAMYLFELELNQVEVVIHPQSLIHSMVCYTDGSIISQASMNDMKIPISYCLGWPERIESSVDLLDLTKTQSLTFEKVSKERFPCFYLAKEVASIGESVTTVMNAANEIAVEGFLEKSIKFNDIYKIIYETIEKHNKIKISTIDEVIEIDKEARIKAIQILNNYKKL